MFPSSIGLRCFGKRTFLVANALIGLYLLVARPPLHIVFNRVPDPSSDSVCVPGSGFSGFWYHMGFISRLNLTATNTKAAIHNESQFYCYSSGCLSLVLAGHSKEYIYEVATSVQDDWLQHQTVSQYDLVEHFLNQTLGITEERCDSTNNTDSCPITQWIQNLLPRLHIMITSWNKGVRVEKALSVEHLAQLLKHTTHIPLVTGPARALEVEGDLVLDGAFSRTLHPSCRKTISVPLFDKGHLLHSLNPAMSKESIWDFWNDGEQAAALVVDKELLESEDAGVRSFVSHMA